MYGNLYLYLNTCFLEYQESYILLFDLYFQDRMMKELHSNGKTIEDIANVLKRAPLHPNIISAIKSAHALG